MATNSYQNFSASPHFALTAKNFFGDLTRFADNFKKIIQLSSKIKKFLFIFIICWCLACLPLAIMMMLMYSKDISVKVSRFYFATNFVTIHSSVNHIISWKWKLNVADERESNSFSWYFARFNFVANLLRVWWFHKNVTT
jgi:hypothetical protein